MDQAEALKILETHKAVIRDTHVVYTSGKHGDAYVNKDAIYPDTQAVASLCQAISEHFKTFNVEVVAAPAIGGVILSQWVAHHLSTGRTTALAVYAEKAELGSFVFRRGYNRLLDKKRVLVVEDILTTGTSLKEVISAARLCDAMIVGAAALCNRGGITAEQIGSPHLYTLVTLPLESSEEESCPLCAAGVPINTDVGKGREYLLGKQ